MASDPGPFFCQRLCGGHATPDQNYGGDWNLESNPECEENFQDEVEIAVNVSHYRYVCRCNAGEKRKDQWEYDEVSKGGTGVKQDHTGGQ